MLEVELKIYYRNSLGYCPVSLSQFGTVTNGCTNWSYVPGKSLCLTQEESHNSENNADVNKEKAGEETYKSLL